jgi:hypothetical protein
MATGFNNLLPDCHSLRSLSDPIVQPSPETILRIGGKQPGLAIKFHAIMVLSIVLGACRGF